jgi:methyl-accepting chemotaxis protein
LREEVKSGRLDHARSRIAEAKAEFKKFRDTNKKILESTDRAIADARQATKKAYASTLELIAGFCAVAAIIAVFVATTVARSIVRPIRALSARLESMSANDLASLSSSTSALAEGDLTIAPVVETQPLALSTKDEVGAMARTFDAMLGSLQSTASAFDDARLSLGKIITNIKAGSKQIAETSLNLASGAEQSGSAADDIAKGSDSLAKNASDAASIMAEFSAQVDTIKADSGKQESTLKEAEQALGEAEAGIGGVAHAAEKMAAAAQEGHGAVQATVAAMGRVQERVDYSSAKVQELDSKGKEIGRIVLSIQSIAEQTNLLALNAAIEAARAGEHGRGFAVVADEVRKLAEQAANATREIGSLIEGVTHTVHETVEAIDSATSEVSEGANRSTLAGKSLEQILNASEEVAARSQEVAALTNHASARMGAVSKAAHSNAVATEEMAVGADRVAHSISNVAAISEESAAGAEELNATIGEVSQAAIELSQMSAQFLEQIARFKVESESTRLRLAA